MGAEPGFAPSLAAAEARAGSVHPGRAELGLPGWQGPHCPAGWAGGHGRGWASLSGLY